MCIQYTTFMGLWWRLRVGDFVNVKVFFVCKKLSSRNRSQNGFFEFRCLNIKYSHLDPPKGTSLPGRTSFDVFCLKSIQGYRPFWRIPPKTNRKLVTSKARQNYFLGRRNPWTYHYKFRMSGAIRYIIAHGTFNEDWLRVLAWRGIEFLPFPLTCLVAIRPLSLLCECVILIFWWLLMLTTVL